MTSEVLSLIFSLIGCITGIISLSISILYFIYQKPYNGKSTRYD